ncbi:sulfate transmembrane transporter [Actinidia rufa]|uniref:Sulfate transmembrane transporter n=1 Tax=Actinidia rufa TaxID=165716 RepID=A0A7J0GU45_9ERIC|nr:sulfate transmembrane transporter [Actinidia rufa]
MEEGHPHPPTPPPRSTVAPRRRRGAAVDISVAAIWKVERWGFLETAEAAIWEVEMWGFRRRRWRWGGGEVEVGNQGQREDDGDVGAEVAHGATEFRPDGGLKAEVGGEGVVPPLTLGGGGEAGGVFLHGPLFLSSSMALCFSLTPADLKNQNWLKFFFYLKRHRFAFSVNLSVKPSVWLDLP